MSGSPIDNMSHLLERPSLSRDRSLNLLMKFRRTTLIIIASPWLGYPASLNAKSLAPHRYITPAKSGKESFTGYSLPKRQELYCHSKECKLSISPHRAMLRDKFQLIFDGAPACKIILAAINQGNTHSANPSVFPKTEYNYIDTDRIFGADMFLKWHAVPYWYNDPHFLEYKRDEAQLFRPDAWLTVQYLNDNTPRLVVSGAWAYLTTKEVTENVFPSSFPDSHWSEISSYAHLQELIMPPMGPCNDPSDPLTQILADRPVAVGHDGMSNCTVPWATAVHTPPDKKHLYRIIADFSYFTSFVPKNMIDPRVWPIFNLNDPIEFSKVDKEIYTLFTFSDFALEIFTLTGTVRVLTTGVIIRVVKFSGNTFNDTCLLAVGTGVTATSAAPSVESSFGAK